MALPMTPATPEMQPAGHADMGAPEGEAKKAYTICIKVAADGTIMVGTEDEAQEAPEAEAPPPMPGQPPAPPAMGEEDEDESSSMQPVSSIKEALTTALDIYRSNGQMDNKTAMGESFAGGFKGA